MESADLELLRTCRDWLHRGEVVHLVTVLSTWGSAPRPAGALAAFSAAGRVVGSLSGGCVEADLGEALARDPVDSGGPPRRVEYGVDADQARRFGLPCGGRLELVAERLSEPGALDTLLAAMEERSVRVRELDLASGATRLLPASRDDAASPVLDCDGERLRRLFGPVWQLILVGAGQLSRLVAEMACALDYRVIVCDPREGADLTLAGAECSSAMPDDLVRERVRDARSAVVALTHDPRLDDMALMEALVSPAFYVGALGSRANQAKRRGRLAELGLPAQAIDRLHGPVGLPLGGKRPAEIAVSVVAELTAARNGRLAQAAAALATP